MRRAFTLTEALVMLAALFLIMGIAWPILSRPRPDRGTLYCQRNLKQIGLGFLQYAQDYDERFPPARTSSTMGWGDGLLPYTKSRLVFYCPWAKPPAVAPTTVSSLLVDYFYNRQLAGVRRNQIPNDPFTIMAGDGPVNGTTWSSWAQLPADAVTNSYSPAQRHATNALVGGGNGANYLFADGHVKFWKPDRISNSSPKPDTGEPTFAVR